MSTQEVEQIIGEMGYPYKYNHFEVSEAAEPPYIVYLYPETHHFYADGIVYQMVNQMDIELYTDSKDWEAEKKVEDVLKKYGFFYKKSEIYIESEKMYEVIYETEVLING